jgi:hypothetical protein
MPPDNCATPALLQEPCWDADAGELRPLLVDMHGILGLIPLSPDTIHRLIRAGTFPPGRHAPGLEPKPDRNGKVKGGRLLWRYDVVEQWVEENFPRQVEAPAQ